MSLYIKTETLPETDKISFDTRLFTDGDSDIITIVTTSNDSIKQFVIRRQIVFSKWRLAREQFELEAKTIRLSVNHSIVENLLKLIYGYQIAVSNHALYDLWLFSVETGYSNTSKLLENLEVNINNLTNDQKIKVLTVSNNKNNIINKMSIKEIRQLSGEHLNDLSKESLTSMIEAVSQKYKIDTQSQKTEIIKLKNEIKLLTEQINELKNTQKTTPYNPNMFDPNILGSVLGLNGLKK